MSAGAFLPSASDSFLPFPSKVRVLTSSGSPTLPAWRSKFPWRLTELYHTRRIMYHVQDLPCETPPTVWAARNHISWISKHTHTRAHATTAQKRSVFITLPVLILMYLYKRLLVSKLRRTMLRIFPFPLLFMWISCTQISERHFNLVNESVVLF